MIEFGRMINRFLNREKSGNSLPLNSNRLRDNVDIRRSETERIIRADAMGELDRYFTYEPVIVEELKANGETEFDLDSVEAGWVIRSKMTDKQHYWQIVTVSEGKKYFFRIEIKPSDLGNNRNLAPILSNLSNINFVRETETPSESHSKVRVEHLVKTFHPHGLKGHANIDVTGIVVFKAGPELRK